MSQQDMLTLAKQGDPRAIATLLNRSTQSHGITVKAARQHQDLFLLIEAAQVPEAASMVSLVRQAMIQLEVASVRTVKIFGRQTGDKTASWNQDLSLPLLDEPPDPGAIGATDSNQSERAESDAVEILDLGLAPDPALPLPEPSEVPQQPDHEDEFAAALDAELNSLESPPPELAPDDPEATLEPVLDEVAGALEAVTEAVDGALEAALEPGGEPVDQPESVAAIAPDVAPDAGDAIVEAVEPASIDLPESEPFEAMDEVPTLTEAQFPNSPTLDLEAALETLGPDETVIYIEGPDPKPEDETAAHLPPESPLASVAVEPPDYWADAPDPPRSISVPESIPNWAEQRITTVSVQENPGHPSQAESDLAVSVPETLAPELPWEESEMRALLKKPEALAVLLVVILVTLWDAYFQVLDEAEMTDGALSGRALSRRLGTSASTVRRRREQADFSAWTQTLDPDGIAWIYREDGKFVPRL